MTASPVEIPVGEAYRRERLVRGGVAVIVANVVQKTVGVVLVAVLARELSGGAFGAFAFALAYGAFVQTIADLGLDVVTTRELASAPESDEGRIVGSALVAKCTAVGASLVVAAVATLAFPIDLRLIALIASLTACADLPSTLALPMLARVRTLGPQVIQTVGIASGALLLLGAAWGGLSIRWLVAINVGSNIATGAALAVRARRLRTVPLHVDRATVITLVRASLPIALSTIAVVVFVRVDQLLLGAFGEVEALGGYAISVKVVEALNVVPVALAAIVLPTLSHLQRDEPDRAARLLHTAFRWQAAVILPIAALGTVAGGDLLAVLFGESFRSSGAVLALLLWAHYPASSWVLARQALVVAGRTTVLVQLAILAAVLNIGLNLWLIPTYGALGAAWASLISYTAPVLVGSARKESGQPFRACIAASVRPGLGASVVLGALLVAPHHPIMLVTLFVVVVPTALLISRSTSVAEVRGIVASFRDR